MSKEECRIFQERQAKLRYKNEYFIHELLGEVPQAFIQQVMEIDESIDRQLKELREKGYLSGSITTEEP